MERGSKKQEFEQELNDYIQIRDMVGKCLARQFDQGNVAANIWLELWQKSQSTGKRIPPTWMHVRNRCIDELRRVIRRRETSLEGAKRFGMTARVAQATEEMEATRRDNKELLDQIMKCPSLSAEERLLLYRKYYADATLKEISRERGESRTTVKRLLKDIMNRLRSWIVENPTLDSKGEEDVE